MSDMAEGLWVVLGAAIGTVGSVSTTWLAAHLQRQSQFPKFDKAAEALLGAMLENGPNWREIQTLAAVSGMTEKDTKAYLIVMGARGSETDKNLWGVKRRAIGTPYRRRIGTPLQCPDQRRGA
jgi:hypothetical protein